MIQAWLSRPKTDGGCQLCRYDEPPDDNWAYIIGNVELRLCKKHRAELRATELNTCPICRGNKTLLTGSGTYKPNAIEKRVPCPYCLGTGEHQEGKALEEWDVPKKEG